MLNVHSVREQVSERNSNKTRLRKYVYLRSDEAMRRAAFEKNDTRMIAVVSRKLGGAEVHYHRSCYKNYTRAKDRNRKEVSRLNPEREKLQQDNEKETEA